MVEKIRVDQPDLELLNLRLRLEPERRHLAMLDGFAFATAHMRASLQQKFPKLSSQEINLKILEEIEDAKRREARAYALLRHTPDA